MRKTIAIAAIAAAVLGSVASAQAGPWHPRHHARIHYSQTVRGPQVGPVWSGPNQCWTDEGYGRYAPCDGRQ